MPARSLVVALLATAMANAQDPERDAAFDADRAPALLPDAEWLRGLDARVRIVGEYAGTRAAAANLAAVTTIEADFDLDELAELRGMRAFASVRSRAGGLASDASDAAHGASTLDAPEGESLAEAWLEQRFAGDAIALRAGQLDANATFAALDAAGDFTLPAFATSPTIVGMPTWPDSALGAQLRVGRESGAYASFGVLRGMPRFGETPLGLGVGLGVEEASNALDRGVFAIGETGARFERGRLALGAWRDGGARQRVDGDLERGASGGYALAEHTLWQSDARAVNAFALLGLCTDPVTETREHALAGVELTGPFHRRPDDSIGVAVSALRLDTGGGTRDRELALETYYRLALSNRTHLQLGVAHVGGADDDGGAALQWNVRFAMDL